MPRPELKIETKQQSNPIINKNGIFGF